MRTQNINMQPKPASEDNETDALNLCCPKCFNRFEPKEMNASMAIAQCPFCQSAFRFANQLSDSPRMMGAFGPIELPKPPTVEAQDFGDRLVIKRSWKGRFTTLLIGTALVLNGCLAAFYYFAISSNAPALALFPFPVQIVGLIIGYIALARAFNTTTLQIEEGILTTKHSPVPWKGATTMAVDQVRQFFVLRTFTRGENGNVNYKHGLYAKLYSGLSLPVMPNLENSWQALYIEQEIENFLGIPNKAVEGEVSRQDIANGIF